MAEYGGGVYYRRLVTVNLTIVLSSPEIFVLICHQCSTLNGHKSVRWILVLEYLVLSTQYGVCYVQACPVLNKFSELLESSWV